MQTPHIAVIGLGYVGLPLARLLSTKFPTIGFDLSTSRVESVNSGCDRTGEVASDLLRSAIDAGFRATCCEDDIRACNVYIVAVPTPVDINNHPDITPLHSASALVGRVISKGDVVIYE